MFGSIGHGHQLVAQLGRPPPRAAPAADTDFRSVRRRHPRSPGRSVELLQALAPAVPDEMTVVVLCDRGLASPKLWQQIRAQSLPRRRPGAGIRFRFLLRGSPLRPLFPSQQQQRGQAALRPCCWCALRAFAYWCGRLPVRRFLLACSCFCPLGRRNGWRFAVDDFGFATQKHKLARYLVRCVQP